MRILPIKAGLFLVASGLPAAAVQVNWIDWQSSETIGGVFTAYGVIQSGTETIDVTYRNPNGVAGIQTNGGTYYYTPNSDENSPYTSDLPFGADNRPPESDIIQLRYAGTQSLTFSQTVENLYYAFVSLNGNGYTFDQDFQIQSYTGSDLDGSGTDSNGYWGTGEVVRVDNGDGTYSLNASSGEPHGLIYFADTFDTLTWDSLSNEYWNGFTIGIQGTKEQVSGAVPLPGAGWLLLSGLAGAAALKRRKSA